MAYSKFGLLPNGPSPPQWEQPKETQMPDPKVDFRSLLAQPLDDVKRPQPLPAGDYNGVIKSFEFMESSKKKTPFVRFHLGITAPGEDVIAQESEVLKGIDLAKKQINGDYFFTDDAKYRLKDFLESCNINTAGRTWDETIPEAINQQVMMTLALEPDQNDPMIQYNRVTKLVGQP